MKIINYLVAMLIVWVALAGCSTPNYGKIRKPTDSDEQVTIVQLGDNWQYYDVYYATRYSSRPAAVMFDPKSDDKKLVGKGWYKINDPVTLAKTIRIIQIWYSYAIVGIIKSPDGRVFGYMYYPPELNIPIRMLDERTLSVSTLPLPESRP